VDRLQRISIAGFILLFAACLLSACSSTASRRTAPSAAPVRTVPKVLHGQYRVRRGDTLYSIARRHGWDWRVLAAHNRIGSPYTLKVGQIIRFDNRPVYRPRTPVQSRAPQRSSPPRAPVRRAPAPPPPRAKSPPRKPSTAVQPAHKSATLATIKWQWPTDGALIGRFAGNNGLNKGIDIAGNPGQPIRAAADGLVTYAGNGLYGNGEALVIKHGGNLVVSVYGHNRRLLVKEGQPVKAGQVIAEMGATGTDRVKLHFEIRHQSKAVDPLLYLPRR